MLSAQLDGEDEQGDRDRTDVHLSGCAGCREWLDRAASVNRLTRTSLVGRVPDLSATILAALPPAVASDQAAPDPAAQVAAGGRDRRSRLALALFVALGLVGAVQLILGLAQVGGGTTGGHSHAGAGLTATPGHLWHESAAWNVAVGAAFLFIALRRTRPTGVVPMLTAFVAMLLLLSVNDLTAGVVEASRLVSHGFVIGGYLLVVALSRVTAGPSAPPGERAPGAGWRARFDETEGSGGFSGLRLVQRSGTAPVTAQLRRDERRAA
jgi:predicted anti-sigma-YlaC factor YlaD